MIKLAFVSILIVACKAGGGGYGGGGVSSGSSYGLGNINFGSNSLGGVGPGVPVSAAVQSTHTVEIQTVDVPYNPIQPQIVEVDANVLPLTIHFRSASSNLNVFQTHQPSNPGEVQQTSSEDEPQHLIHEVTKPIIQEVREYITPYRRVIQEIKPVQEQIQTIISRGEGRSGNIGNLGLNFGSGGAINAGGYSSGSLNNIGFSSGPISGVSTGGGAISGGGVSILSGDAAKSLGSGGSKSSGASSLRKYSGDTSSQSINKDYSSS